MPLDSLLLAALRDGPSHGYRLGRQVARLRGGTAPPEPAAIYRALARLERRGSIEALAASPGRRRRYRITAAGERELAASCERAVAPHRLLRRPLLGWLAALAAYGRVPASAVARPPGPGASAVRSAAALAERERRHRAVEAAALAELAALARLSRRRPSRSSASR